MNDFNTASGLNINAQTYNASQEAERSREALQERQNRAAYEHAKAEHERKAAAEAAMVAEGVERGMRLAFQYQGRNTGQALHGAAQEAEAAAKTSLAAPQALVDQLPLMIGGINIGPKEAQGMLARGEVSRSAYAAALNKELARYGMVAPGF